MSAVSLSQINLRSLCLLSERPTRDTCFALFNAHTHVTQVEETVFAIRTGNVIIKFKNREPGFECYS